MPILGVVEVKENSGNDLTDYQILIEIKDSWFFSKCSDQKYLEILDEDKQTILNHWVETFDPVNNIAKIWVKIPSIKANSVKKIYINVNYDRTEDLSNGDNVFLFFDDFNDDSKWSLHSLASIHDGVLDYDHGASNYSVEKVKKLPPVNIAIEHLTYVKQRCPYNAGIDIMLPVNTAGNDDSPINGNFYLVVIDGNGYQKYYKHVSTSWYNTYNVNYAIPLQEWLRIKTTVFKDSRSITFKFFVNDELISKWTDSDPLDVQDGYLAFREGYMMHDWIFVRNYIEPEPTVNVYIGYPITINVYDEKGLVIPKVYYKVGNSNWKEEFTPITLASKENITMLLSSIGFRTKELDIDVSNENYDVTLEPILYDLLEFIRKYLSNRWQIKNNELIIYDDDGITPIKRFKLYDKEGNPTEDNVYDRRPIQ